MAQVPSTRLGVGDVVDYTPSQAVSSGDVVVLGTRVVLIAILNIAANALGALAIRGLFRVPKVTGAITALAELYYDLDGDPLGGTAGTGAFTTDSTKGPFAGWATRAAGAEDTGVDLYLCSAPIAGTSAVTPFVIDLTQMKVHDARATNLPAAAANDDMGIITGTPGTDAPTLQGVDFGGGSTDEKAAFAFALPPSYVAGSPITVRVKAGMVTGVSDGTATVDVEAWKRDGTGAAGADLCSTAAQSINSLTAANKDFTITPTGLVAGDVLDVRLSFGGSDVGNAVVMIPEIQDVRVLTTAKVG